jgi:iron complex transport system ATP-binding protein
VSKRAEARALAQQMRFFVLDEPTNHLDIRYQLKMLDQCRGSAWSCSP